MQLSFSFRPPAVVCAGARASEERLLAEVGRLRDAARRDPALLSRPVRIVVPSRGLRLHLASVLAARLGPHLLGIKVETVHGLAQELVGARDEVGVAMGILGKVLALRHARAEEPLARLLDEFDDAQDTLIQSVDELVAAGLRDAHVDAALDALEEAADLAPGERARACAMVRAAARTADVTEQLGIESPSRVLEAAAARLARPGSPPLNARAILLHGFADATGVMADLLEQLASQPGAIVFADLPPDPAEPGAVDAAVRFGARFRERLRVGGAPEAWTEPGALEVFTAEGDDGEALETARRVVEMLEAGARPEGIAVVARDLDARTPSLRRHFDRLGVPYSSLDVSGPDTPLARWRRLVELLRLGPRMTTDRWLDFLGAFPAARPKADADDFTDASAGHAEPPADLPPAVRAALRLGLRAAGAARLGQAAQLDPRALLRGKDVLALPGGGGFDGPRVAHRKLAADVLRGALTAARATCAWWAALPPAAKPAEWYAHLRALLVDVLGQPEDHPALQALEPLGALPGLTLEAEEVRVVAASLLAELGRGRFGGAGAGVHVLAVREARGRTFEHLFLLGNNRRNTNPRDAVLSDPVRHALRAVIPDLPLRRDRFDEDRFHFAWLLSAAPRVTLSWQTIDARGKTASVSPLVERLRWAGRWTTAVAARPPYPAEPPPIATHAERATIAALRGGVEALGPHLAAALAEARPADAVLRPPELVAAAQVAVLAEKEGPRDALAGPYQGWIGPARDEDDPRARLLYVSVLEKLVECPWRSLLEIFLGAEPVRDPLARIPQADNRLAGILVHRVLEGVVRDALPASGGAIGDLEDRAPVVVPWPGDEAVRALARREAARILEDEGIRLPGLAELVAIRAEPFLEAARSVDWASGGPHTVGAEIEGFVHVDGRRIAFRVDRADLEHGVLTLTDYKTGRNFADAKDPDTRHDRLLARIRAGKSLQAAAYAAAEGAERLSGRYLFLAPDVETRSLRVHSEDDDVTEALFEVARTTVRAVEAGVFFPRLVEPVHDKEPAACKRCVVAEACLRSESGDRVRLRALARELRHGERPAERAFSDLWMLPEGR